MPQTSNVSILSKWNIIFNTAISEIHALIVYAIFGLKYVTNFFIWYLLQNFLSMVFIIGEDNQGHYCSMDTYTYGNN